MGIPSCVMSCKRYPWLSLLCAISIACGSGSDNGSTTEWKQYSETRLREIIGSHVVLPDSLCAIRPDSLTIGEIMQSHAKIIFNVDLDCSVCISKFAYWEDFAGRFERRHHHALPIMAVITSSDFDDATEAFVGRLWKRAWIYDPMGDFTFYNKIEDDRFQAILCDAFDTIRLVGNPLLNKKLEELYEKTTLRYLQSE